MLQFITHPSEKYTIAEEVKMAIDGGCQWIQLRMKDATNEEVKATALEIIPMCKEKDVILVIDDRVELTKELLVHGVHLGKEDMPPAEAREYLGAGAIIGATANTAADIIALRKTDIDYIGLGPFRYTTTKSKLSPVLGLDGYRSIVKEVREAGIDIPIVAIGGITIDDIEDIMLTGVNGIALSGEIINAEDPTTHTAEIIRRCFGKNQTTSEKTL